MKRRRIFFSLLLIALALTGSKLAFGESLQKFDAQIQMNAHQADRKNSYFDLILQPQQTETLIVRLTNFQDSAVRIKPSFHRARTNQLGVIEYSGRNQDRSEGLPTDIQKIVSLNTEELRLEPKQEILFPIEIKMPENTFDGVLAGGIYFEEIPEDRPSGNIKNIFSREIALLVRNNESQIAPKIAINQAKAAQDNFRNAIKVQLQNTQAGYLSNGHLTYQLYFEDGNEPILNGEKSISFAPNSGTDYLIPLEGQEFKPGKYRVALTVSKGSDQWQGDSDFTVAAKQADTYNDRDVTLDQPQRSNLTMILVVVLLLLVIIIGILAIKLRKKQNDQQ